MRALIITIAFLSIFLSTTRQTKAQPCPGNGLMSATFNVATATGNGAYTMQFVATGMFCGGVPSGAATGCIQGTAGGPVFFRASWPNTAARTGDPAGGCVFTCPLGTCRVGQTAYPWNSWTSPSTKPPPPKPRRPTRPQKTGVNTPTTRPELPIISPVGNPARTHPDHRRMYSPSRGKPSCLPRSCS